ncbi:uncharacterized protein LOC134801217 isoform X2 [Cydia splendana]|uniref:uncharacterized protein LOC134801217 isoform X2 n=1 Tax=Cydia splendana TaxID=1100963 RepID=UPI00300C160D
MIYDFRKSFLTLLCASCHILIDASVINVGTTVPPDVGKILEDTNLTEVSEILNKSRRIISGVESAANRPYMVYLQLPANNPKYRDYRRWLCGGVIIHEEYILTSAACIEDARNFYVVSGTYKHSEDWSSANNLCIKNGAKKAIWKCVPRNYVFDGHENDNIRWMNNDIAVVRVEDEFDFERRVKGCDYVPKPICYNNRSSTFENPGNAGIIAGWGSTEKYDDWVNSNRREMNMNVLRETEVHIISKRKCKRRWGSRYANIIDNYMICTKDLVPDLSEVCEEKYVDCTDIMYSGESGEKTLRRRVIDPSSLVLHSPFHNESSRRNSYSSGGFCENDHGGPLIADDGHEPLVIGIISACLVKERTNKCYGPFLYTSVYKNRVLINCAIFKTNSNDCSKMYRSSITHTETVLSWVDHPDGPAKNEIAALRRAQERNTNATQSNEEHLADGDANATNGLNGTVGVNATAETAGSDPVKEVQAATGAHATHGQTKFVDKAQQHRGIVMRSG